MEIEENKYRIISTDIESLIFKLGSAAQIKSNRNQLSYYIAGPSERLVPPPPPTPTHLSASEINETKVDRIDFTQIHIINSASFQKKRPEMKKGRML